MLDGIALGQIAVSSLSASAFARELDTKSRDSLACSADVLAEAYSRRNSTGELLDGPMFSAHYWRPSIL